MAPPFDERTAPASRPPQPPSPAPVEHTRWSPGLIGFYLSCAGVALGATFAASGKLFFGSDGWLVFGIVLAAVSIVTTYLSLTAARRAPSESGRR